MHKPVNITNKYLLPICNVHTIQGDPVQSIVLILKDFSKKLERRGMNITQDMGALEGCRQQQSG